MSVILKQNFQHLRLKQTQNCLRFGRRKHSESFSKGFLRRIL